jgi:hypothetical protein
VYSVDTVAGLVIYFGTFLGNHCGNSNIGKFEMKTMIFKIKDVENF